MGFKQLITEFFTAHYNPDNGQIEGCVPGGLAWEHEKRHQEQFKMPLIKAANHITSAVMQLGGWFWIFFGWANNMRFEGFAMAGISMVPFLLMVLALEVDAWVVSVKRKYL